LDNKTDASKITALIKLKEKMTVSDFCQKHNIDYYSVRNLATGLSTGIKEGTKSSEALKVLIDVGILSKEYIKQLQDKVVTYKEIKEKDIKQRKDVPALIKINLDLSVTNYYKKNEEYFLKHNISLVDINVFNNGVGTGIRKPNSQKISKACYIREKLEEDGLIKPINEL